MTKKFANILAIYVSLLIILDILFWGDGTGGLIGNRVTFKVLLATTIFLLPGIAILLYRYFQSKQYAEHKILFWIVAIFSATCVAIFAYIAYPILKESGTL